jgi:D-alanyl-lipoteichoic acid acyltransferase DltB (MBOAT superfamily)
MQRQQVLAQKKQALAAIPKNNKGVVIAGIIIGLAIAIFCVISLGRLWGGFIVGLLIGGGCIALFVVNTPKWKDRDAQRATATQDIAAFEAELTNAINNFRKNMKPLAGIYENLNGDSNAF